LQRTVLCFSTSGLVYSIETIDAYADWLEVHSHTSYDDDNLCNPAYVAVCDDLALSAKSQVPTGMID
jgi:hypothetical protein